MDLSKLNLDRKEVVEQIELSKIIRDSKQPRKDFNEDKLQELARDIETNGLLQPIIVRKDSLQYVIIAGERRYRAFQLLGKEKIPAIVRKVEDDSKIGYLQMSENIKRDELKYYEIADFITSRIELGEKKGEIADKLGMKAQRISDYLTWSEAPDWLRSYKENFKTIRTFSEFAKEAEKNGEALKEFMALQAGFNDDSAELFTSSTLKAFREKLSSGGSETPYENSSNEHTAEADAEPAGENSGYDSSWYSEEGVGMGHDPQEASEGEDSSRDDVDDYEDAFSNNESNSSPSACSDDGEGPDLEREADEILSNDDAKTRYRKPLILGTIDGRNVEFLYKVVMPDGFIMVKFEDSGEEEERLAEEIKINRVIEG